MASQTAGSHQLTAEHLLKVARTAKSAGDLDRALGFYRGLGEVQPKNPRWAFEAIRLLRATNRDSEAKAELAAAMRKWPYAAAQPELAALVPELKPAPDQIASALGKDCPPNSALKRPLVEDDGGDCMVVRGGRKAAVLVFTGLADRMAMPLPLFDRYLAELDLSAVYLRDTRRFGYFHGVASLGSDYDQTIMRLKELLVDLGAMTVHTIGNSAGGMGAVSYGLDLRAKTVLGFSAPTALLNTTFEVDRRHVIFNTRMMKNVPEPRRDFRARVQASKGSTHIHLYYGEDMPEDRYHASALEGLPQVSLHPISGLAGHGALFRVAENHGLRKLFAERFGLTDKTGTGA